MSEHLLRLSKADDEDERDLIYEGIYEVAEVCPHLSSDMVNRYNNHERLVALARDVQEDIAETGHVQPDTCASLDALLAELEAGKGGE